MKKNHELINIFLITIILLYLLCNTTNLNNYIIFATKLWFYKVFPFLFTMIILNNLLISNNILYYLNKIFKKNGIKYYVLIMSLLSGSPTNTLIIKELYNKQIINKKDADKLLLFTHFSNPIFLISMLSSLFTKKIVIKLIIIHYIPNIIISFFIKINPNKQDIIIKKDNFNTILNKALNTSLMVLGTLVFYILISNIVIDIFNLNNIYRALFKGLLEITQGLNEITNLNINTKLKTILTVSFLNLGGLSIHSQTKSIISDTSISYKYFLLGRIIQLLLGVFINNI